MPGGYSARKRRSILEIVRDILECIADAYPATGMRKSELARCSNLNTLGLNKYLSLLERNGIVRVTKAEQGEYVLLTPHGLLVKKLVEKLYQLLYMHEEKSHVVSAGIKLHEKIREIMPGHFSLPARIGVLLDHCEYIVAAAGICVVCVREDVDTPSTRLEVVCCTIQGSDLNEMKCRVIAELPRTEASLSSEELEKVISAIREECCKL